MKNKRFGHLKPRLFTINTSKNVGFGGAHGIHIYQNIYIYTQYRKYLWQSFAQLSAEVSSCSSATSRNPQPWQRCKTWHFGNPKNNIRFSYQTKSPCSGNLDGLFPYYWDPILGVNCLPFTNLEKNLEAELCLVPPIKLPANKESGNDWYYEIHPIEFGYGTPVAFYQFQFGPQEEIK